MSAWNMTCPKCGKVFADPAVFKEPDGKEHYQCVTCRQGSVKPSGWDLGRALRKSAGMTAMHLGEKLGPEITAGMLVRVLATQGNKCPILGIQFVLPGEGELERNQTILGWAHRVGKDHRLVPVLVRLHREQGWAPGNLIFVCAALTDVLRLYDGSVEGFIASMKAVLA